MSSIENMIPDCAQIKIPTDSDRKEYWVISEKKTKDWKRNRVLHDFPRIINQMFMENKSQCSIVVDESDLEFFMQYFQQKGYKPVPYRWTDHILPGEKEVIFYRKDIEPNYTPLPTKCCIIL